MVDFKDQRKNTSARFGHVFHAGRSKLEGTDIVATKDSNGTGESLIQIPLARERRLTLRRWTDKELRLEYGLARESQEIPACCRRLRCGG